MMMIFTRRNLFIILIILSVYDVEPCDKSWNICGDSFCCCKGSIARCKNQNITFIPKLPANIKSLTFEGNDIKTVSANIFSNISELQIEYLGLISNGIENIHKDSFVNLVHLRRLSLSKNYVIDQSQLSSSLYSLNHEVKSIFLDSIGLEYLPDDIFDGLRQCQVKYIALRNNRIKILNEKSFYYLQKLESLELSNNWISNISCTDNGSRLGHKNLESIILKNNEFVYWPPWFCHHDSRSISLYPNLRNLDLQGNTIIVLVNRAWSCLKRLRNLNLARNVIEILTKDIFLDLSSLNSLQLSEMAKPIRQIHAKAFHNLHLEVLHFDHNNIVFKPGSHVPYREVFKFTPNLKKLYLSYNNFGTLSEISLIEMLSPLSALTDLYLQGARIHRIPENLFDKLSSLTKLYLGNNKIQWINPAAFVNVTNLRVLHLETNKIRIIDDTFPVTLRRSLKELNLARNPFSCQFCASRNNTWFIHWVNKSRIKFTSWPADYKCTFPPSEYGTLLQSHNPTKKDCEPPNPLIVAYIIIGTFLAIVSIIGIAGYKGRWYIRYWTIKCHRQCFSGERRNPERQRLIRDEIMYDAYVIYHDDDRAFVRKEILQFMEEEHHYKLFIWDRDFTAGDQTVAIVVDNMCKSYHVIAVISKSFLKDQWCDFQLAVALDRQIELKQNYLTLLTLEDVDRQLLSKSWCVLLTRTPTAAWCTRRNDIRRKLFEDMILSNVPCRSSRPNLSRQSSADD